MAGDTTLTTDASLHDGSLLWGNATGAVKLNDGLADIAINWAGGLHHAKKSEVPISSEWQNAVAFLQ